MTKDNIDELLDKKTEDYGDGVEAMETIAEKWTLTLNRMGVLKNGTKLKGSQICLLMIDFKINREAKKHKPDLENWTDVLGYAQLGKKCESQEAKK